MKSDVPNPKSRWAVVWPLALGLIFAGIVPSFSQTPAVPAGEEDFNIQSLFEKAGNLMEEGQWEQALVPLEKIIKEYGPSGFEDFGPAFGVMHYRHGFCLKNLKRFEEALAAYETCHKKGGNPPNTPKDKLNPVWELSLLEMGVIKQALGKFAEAVKDYEAFAAKPAPVGSYDEAAFRVQAATAYSKAGQPDRAKSLLEQLFSGAGGVKAKPDGLLRALLALVESWTSEENAKNPETERQAHQFMDANVARITLTPYDLARFEFNNRLLALARTASDRGQQTLAIRLISMIASASEVAGDLQARAAKYNGKVPPLLSKEMEKYAALSTAEDGLDWIAALTLAGCHEKLGNYAVGQAIYTHGISAAPKSPHRPIFLFGAMRCSLATGQSELAKELGSQFRKEFPEHEYAGNVNTLMLENLFQSKRWEEALNFAMEVRSGVADGHKDRDLTDFVVGASQFNLGKIAEARMELESHAKRFPDSKFKEPVRFFEASSLVRLKDWKPAAERLDAFLKDYPNSEYLGYALLDRATTHFQLGEFPKCLTVTDDLMKQRPDFADLDRALAMRGDSHLMLNNNEQAEAAYLKAKELAATAGEAHAPIVQRSLVQLVRTANALRKGEDVVKYYDEYIGKHKGGFYDAEVIVGALEPLKAAKRGEEAMSELQQVIVRLGSGENGAGLEEAIGSYTTNYMEIVGAGQLLEKLMKFVPDGTKVNNALKAWLLMARIDLLENEAHKDKFPKRAAQIQVAVEELEKFNKDELATYIVVQMGRQLAARGTPDGDQLALQWFESVLKRGQSEHYPLALMGKARVLAKAGDESVMKESVAAFDSVIRELKDKPEYVEEAMLEKGRLYFNRKMFKEASAVFFDMQKDTRFTRTRAEVFFKLGLAYQEMGETDKALEAYTPFVAPPLENRVEYSAEARLRAIEIQTQKGNKDKAFRLAKDTVSRMYRLTSHPAAGPHVEKVKELYKKLREELKLPADPDEGAWGIKS
jgi:tetratricopeptide (TPR) repeat protein